MDSAKIRACGLLLELQLQSYWDAHSKQEKKSTIITTPHKHEKILQNILTKIKNTCSDLVSQPGNSHSLAFSLIEYYSAKIKNPVFGNFWGPDFRSLQLLKNKVRVLTGKDVDFILQNLSALSVIIQPEVGKEFTLRSLFLCAPADYFAKKIKSLNIFLQPKQTFKPKVSSSYKIFLPPNLTHLFVTTLPPFRESGKQENHLPRVCFRVAAAEKDDKQRCFPASMDSLHLENLVLTADSAIDCKHVKSVKLKKVGSDHHPGDASQKSRALQNALFMDYKSYALRFLEDFKLRLYSHANFITALLRELHQLYTEVFKYCSPQDLRLRVTNFEDFQRLVKEKNTSSNAGAAAAETNAILRGLSVEKVQKLSEEEESFEWYSFVAPGSGKVVRCKLSLKTTVEDIFVMFDAAAAATKDENTSNNKKQPCDGIHTATAEKTTWFRSFADEKEGSRIFAAENGGKKTPTVDSLIFEDVRFIDCDLPRMLQTLKPKHLNISDATFYHRDFGYDSTASLRSVLQNLNLELESLTALNLSREAVQKIFRTVAKHVPGTITTLE